MLYALAIAVALSMGAVYEMASPTPPHGAISENEEVIPVLFERDPQDRMTVPVRVEGVEEELHFLIDTGAEQSAISDDLAKQLGLDLSSNKRVISFAGERLVPEVVIGQMNFSSLELRNVDTLALNARALGSDGLIGIDHLRSQEVRFDFEKGELRLRESPRTTKRERRFATEIDLRRKNGRLVLADAYYGRRRLDVVLDTGSSITIGNDALRSRISKKDLGEFLSLNMLTVTGQIVPIRYGELGHVRIGDIVFESMPVAFASTEPFHELGLTDRPAIILGMDVLRSFGTLTIDFRRREASFTPRGGEPLRPRDYWSIGLIQGKTRIGVREGG